MTNDFNVIYFYIIIQSILILIVFVVSLLLYRLISMSNKVSRLAPFSVPVKSNALTTFEKIDILYIKIIKKMYIADTPGFSALDISKYTKEEIKNSFIEFKHNNCKFNDCSHINEKNCDIKNKVDSGKILKSRYENYLNFIK